MRQGYEDCDFSQIDEFGPDEARKEVISSEIGPQFQI